MGTKKKKLTSIGTYILGGRGTPILERDLGRWSEWLEQSENRVLKQDTLSSGVRVSTVFVGIDYNFNFYRSGRPLLWETMIFGGHHDGYCQRYATRKDALAGHGIALKAANDKSSGGRHPRSSKSNLRDKRHPRQRRRGTVLRKSADQ
jgi:hypothetical protein